MHTFLTNLNYILFDFVFFIMKPNIKKLFFLAYFLFSWYLVGTKYCLILFKV